MTVLLWYCCLYRDGLISGVVTKYNCIVVIYSCSLLLSVYICLHNSAARLLVLTLGHI